MLAASLLLGAGVAPAQSPSPSATATDTGAVLEVQPKVVAEKKDEPSPPGVPDPGDLPEATADEGKVAPPAEQPENIRSGEGSAQLQSPQAKQQEAAQACRPQAQRLPISSMLGLPGSIGGGGSADWGPLLLAVALASGAVALLVWRRRAGRDKPEPRDPLETVSTVVALISAVVGLALTFVPGIGIDEPPPRDAQMAVRQAHARITHGEYARRVRSAERLSSEDKREVGNVIWLELRLQGYRDEPLRVQYGAYRARAGGALLPGTTREISLPNDRGDVETSFVPIWIGYPRRTNGLTKFQAHFRLIKPNGEILQLAKTGSMNASEFRYACL